MPEFFFTCIRKIEIANDRKLNGKTEKLCEVLTNYYVAKVFVVLQAQNNKQESKTTKNIDVLAWIEWKLKVGNENTFQSHSVECCSTHKYIVPKHIATQLL